MILVEGQANDMDEAAEIPPLPGIATDSMKSIAPPAGVYARAVATPGIAVLRASSDSNFLGPKIFSSWGLPIVARVAVFFAILVAMYLQIEAIVRSRFLTPASCV